MYKPERPQLYSWDERYNGDSLHIPAQAEGNDLFSPVVAATGFIALDISSFESHEYKTYIRPDDVFFLYEYSLENVNLINRYHLKAYREKYTNYIEELKDFHRVKRASKALAKEAEYQAQLIEEKRLKELATRDEKITNLQRQIDYLRKLK